MSGSGGFKHKQALPQGHILHDRYELLAVLGVGGFGVTYLGHDAELERQVAIKEYFPNEFAVREGMAVHPKSVGDREGVEWGLARFLDEARVLARFRHPNLVRVIDYFRENGTAYIVMDYEQGEPLNKVLKRLGKLSETQLRKLLLPIVDGLREVHAAGFLHRDIKPSNLFIRRSDEAPVLLDFGAARQALGRKSKSLTAIASAGYSPPEQYESDGEQGVWTDVYALSALCYRAITGETPVEAPRRMHRLARGQSDPQPRLVGAAARGYSVAFLGAVDRGLRVDERARPASLEEWASFLSSESSGAGVPSPPDSQVAVRGLPARDESMDVLAPSGGRDRLGRLADRKWWFAGAAAALVASGLGGVLLWDVIVPSVSERESPGNQPPVSEAEGERQTGPGVSSGEMRRVDSVDRPADEAGDAAVADTGSAGQPAPEQAGNDEDGGEPEGSSPGRSPPWREALEEGPQEPSLPSSPIGGEAILVVETVPLGVEVLVGGVPIGRTPLERRDLRSGSRSVTLRHEAYEEFTLEDQSFVDGVVLRIDRQLVRGSGRLTVLTEPRAAWIEWDGRRLATGTPVTLDLPAGQVELTLGAEEHRSVQVEVDVPKEGVETLEHRLQPVLYGTLTLDLAPPDARVEVAGVGGGYRAGMRLREGSYEVTVRRPGYRETTRTVEVSGPTVERVVLERSALVAGETFRDALRSGGSGPEMVVVQAGSFRMGCVSPASSEVERPRTLLPTWLRRRAAPPPLRPPPTSVDCEDDEKPAHEVTIPRALAVGTYEVTFDEWDTCVSAGGCDHRPDDEGWGRGRQPVMDVSWEDAREYVAWLSSETGTPYRLLSESEWEYAARAGVSAAYNWGNQVGSGRANCDGCGSQWDSKTTAPVGSFAANAWGLHDMHGNVEEWVEDCWNLDYSDAPSSGGAWLSGYCPRRVLRGGSWNSYPSEIRSARRFSMPTDSRRNTRGFRVARTIDP